MKTTNARIAIAAIAVTALAGVARAEYRCDSAGTTIDRQACEAARQGPEELRRYVQAMKPVRSDLRFSDYVDRKTAAAWEVRAREQASRDSDKVERSQVAADSQR